MLGAWEPAPWCQCSQQLGIAAKSFSTERTTTDRVLVMPAPDPSGQVPSALSISYRIRIRHSKCRHMLSMVRNKLQSWRSRRRAYHVTPGPWQDAYGLKPRIGPSKPAGDSESTSPAPTSLLVSYL
ncbi:uncharacterized protein B0H18DRAFT_95772 [Fomitopsis serialis]|uniref:uncharacterized protein n=1 Tax=Fomitopsis serialis TaxID=139415 RepID=UPI0020077DFB|nr:uncharacterized protein B0H18DRAFT_95772 [Neoantrodia serialis]KAH9915487.1 hypothetical protein B0H18DRAFT_95772 [Neoantrodia serialis]